MNGRTTTLGGIFGAALLALAAFSASGCPGDDSGDSADGGMSGGGFGQAIATQCGLTCPAAGKGVALGNASISGYAPIDGFFRSVVNYSSVSASVSADIDAELAGIQSLFQITDAQLTMSGNLGAAITAKLTNDFKASVVVNAQPAKCSVDAHVAAEVSAKCQAQVSDCMVTPGMASFQCMGTCNVDANVTGSCSADAQVHCQVTAPSFECSGQCSGSCTVMAPTVACGGTCRGTCDGMCTGGGTSGTNVMGECKGTCGGTCTGGCEVSGMAAASCKGSCNGTCDYNPGMAACDARAKVSCDLNATASASCTGRCNGAFTPPTASCNASASCQASAKAEASFQVHCTPPSLEVKVVSMGGAMAQAQVDFLIAELKARLPRLAVAQARAKLAADAAGELSASGSAAVQSTVGALASAKLDFFVSYRVATCVPPQLGEVAGVIQASTDSLKKRTDSATAVAKAFGMVM